MLKDILLSQDTEPSLELLHSSQKLLADLTGELAIALNILKTLSYWFRTATMTDWNLLNLLVTPLPLHIECGSNLSLW